MEWRVLTWRRSHIPRMWVVHDGGDVSESSLSWTASVQRNRREMNSSRGGQHKRTGSRRRVRTRPRWKFPLELFVS
jgi:hypothetical protein